LREIRLYNVVHQAVLNKVVAPGCFARVRIHSPSSGFEGGAGLQVVGQRSRIVPELHQQPRDCAVPLNIRHFTTCCTRVF
jgi:hypothetical protein